MNSRRTPIIINVISSSPSTVVASDDQELKSNMPRIAGACFLLFKERVHDVVPFFGCHRGNGQAIATL